MELSEVPNMYTYFGRLLVFPSTFHWKVARKVLPVAHTCRDRRVSDLCALVLSANQSTQIIPVYQHIRPNVSFCHVLHRFKSTRLRKTLYNKGYVWCSNSKLVVQIYSAEVSDSDGIDTCPLRGTIKMQRMFTELVLQTGVSKRELMLDISSATCVGYVAHEEDAGLHEVASLKAIILVFTPPRPPRQDITPTKFQLFSTKQQSIGFRCSACACTPV